VVTNDVSDCINLFIRIAHICNHPLQIKHKAFPFTETKNNRIYTSLEKFYVQSPLYVFGKYTYDFI